MIKAVAHVNGRTVLILGLSFKNLDKFRAEPGETFIDIKGEDLNLPFDVMIFSGETEAHLHEMVKGNVGPDTIVHIDPKLRS